MKERGFQFRPGDFQADLQRPFLVTTVDGQNPMRRELGKRLGIIKVVAVLKPLTLRNVSLAGHDLAGLPDDLADRVANRGHLADRFAREYGRRLPEPSPAVSSPFSAFTNS